jgi:hypothetical protein
MHILHLDASGVSEFDATAMDHEFPHPNPAKTDHFPVRVTGFKRFCTRAKRSASLPIELGRHLGVNGFAALI